MRSAHCHPLDSIRLRWPPCSGRARPVRCPRGAMTASELRAGITADQARREAEETVTIREIGRRAGRSSTKEAVGDRPTANVAAERETQQETREVRGQTDATRWTVRARDTEHQWERSVTTTRREAPRTAARAASVALQPDESVRPRRQQQRSAEPLPARDLMESAGRARMEACETPRALAYYQLLGRLRQADEPAARVAELLASDPEAVAVVQNEYQERRLREALAEQGQARPQHEGQPEADPWAGRIFMADAAYDSRRQRREAWLESLEPQARRSAYMAEPEAMARAYVVADEPWASAALVRAVSVAAESHLVVPQIRPSLARDIAAEAESIRTSMETQTRERSREQAERGREHAYGRYAANQAELSAARARQIEREAEL